MAAKKNKKINPFLRILLMTNALIVFAGATLGPILALYIEDLGGDLLAASGAASLYAIVAGMTVFFISKWEDRIKHQERLVVVGYIIIALSFFSYLLIKTPVHLFIVQIFIGLGEAIYIPAYDALYSRNLDDHKEASEWGAWEAMAYIVSAAGALIGGVIVTVYGFDPLFVIMGLLTLVSAFGMQYMYKKNSAS
ncbi:MAG: MFS transporter [Candidatus Kerfeldbacteria bacterium]